MVPRPTLTELNPDDHLYRTTYGLETMIPADLKPRVASLVLAIAAADGELSEREIATIEGIGHATSAPEVVEATVKSSYASRKIEELVDDAVRPLARFILHDAIRIARVDGFDRKERAAAMRAAAKLDVEPDLVLSIEAFFHVEDALRASRLTMLHGDVPDPERLARLPPGRPPPGAALHYYRREQYGVEGPVPVEVDRKIGSAVLCIAGADHELTNREWAYFIGQERALSVPRDLLEELLMFNFETARLEDFLDDSTRPYARLVLYDAVRVAGADGFAQKERDMARRAATRLGEDPSLVATMEGQLMLEESLRKARMRLLSPS